MIRHDVGYNQTILEGDCRECLDSLPDKSVHCAVTSIPYWGLRSYGTEPQVWGAIDLACDHEWGPWSEKHDVREEPIFGKTRTTDRHYGDESRRFDGNHQKHTAGQSCVRCGCWRGELGSEPTPELFVAHIVEAFRAVRRVLRDDGVLWLNCGDSFFTAKGSCNNPGGGETSLGQNRKAAGTHPTHRHNRTDCPNLKPGDLAGVPWSIAFALRDDGWWFRGDWVWAKRSPMPESVSGVRFVRHRIKVKPQWDVEHPHPTHVNRVPHSGNTRTISAEWQDCPGCDKCRAHEGYILRRGRWRHTRAHEFVFMFAKSDAYYVNQEAVRERCVSDGGSCFGSVDSAEEADEGGAQARDCERSDRERYIENGKNPRSWAALSSEPMSEPHFAAFPTQLIAPFIRATCPERCCPNCGAGWAPVVDSQFVPQGDVSEELGIRGHDGQKPMDESNGWQGMPRGTTSATVLDYWPTCTCCVKCEDGECNGHPKPYRPVAGTVLDPFLGSGTTLLVARQLGLNGIGCELSPKYVEIAKRRILGTSARREDDAAGQLSMFGAA